MSSQSAAESTVAIENGLMVATVFSLIIAMFIIYNTFQMTVGERRRQFGVLRALGATRFQVIGTVMREALLFAIVGIVFGWGIGIVGAAAISKATGSLLGVDLPLVTIQWYPLILSAVCGLVVTLVGAFFPAFRAGQMQPSKRCESYRCGILHLHPWV